MGISSLLFLISALGYGSASVLYLWCMHRSCAARPRAATMLTTAGLAVHGAAIVGASIARGHAPFTNIYESFPLVAWALVAVFLLLERKNRITAFGAYVCMIATGLVAWSSFAIENAAGFVHPAMLSGWSGIHVSSTLISYALFALAFAAAIGYVLQEYMLKHKRFWILQRLPSLDVMDSLAYRLVSLGFPLLTLGIITGSMWAQTAWGKYWSWDAKETWSLITWVVYAAYLHVRVVQGWRGKWANRLLMVGFICVIITYIGVSFFIRSKHSLLGG